MGGVKRAHENDVAANPEQPVHPSRKRRLDYTEADAQLAKIYNDLADDVQAVRIKAAGEVVRNLSAKSDQQIERIEKAIARLIKGLCSGRKAARLGFSIALSEVLRLGLELKGSGITLGKITAKISEFTTIAPTAGGQERRDYLLGRRFAYQAVLQSGVGSNATVSIQEWQGFVSAVLELMCERQWLRRECGAMLYEYLVGVGKAIPADRLQILVDGLHEKSLWKTPEGVAIWITLAKHSSKVKLPKGVWQHNGPLSAPERAVLSKVIQEIPIDDEQQGGKAGSGSRQTAPSFAWPVILAEYHSGHRLTSEFAQFWKQVVESGLFHTSSSAERKALGFQVLAMAVSSAPSTVLRQLFTPNLTRCIINQRAGSQRYLFDAAKAALNACIARSKQDPTASSGVIQGLIEEGAANFDQVTKTKTVETLLGQSSTEALLDVVTFIQRLMRKPKHEEQSQADAQRRMLADLLLSIVRSHKEPTELFTKQDPKHKSASPAAWLNVVLDTFIELGYCEPKDDVSPALSEASKSICRSRLSSCVAQLMNLPLADAATAVYGLLKALRASKNSYFHSTASKETKALVKRTDKAIQDAQEKVAKTKNQSKAATAQAFALLFAMSVLQIYNEEPDAVPALEDLHACAGDWGKNTESASVLVELLLSFVSKQSALFRKLAEQVFAAFTGSLTADGLQSMLDILSQKESLTGQQELFAQGDDLQAGAEQEEEEGSDDGSAIDVEDMSDVEMIDGETFGADGLEEGSDDEEDDDEDSEESSDEEEGEEDEEELAAFDKKLAEALGSAALDPDGDEDDQDSDMDDEQMMAVEPALEKVFKEIKKRSGKKQDNKEAKDNIINFKNRILDLLTIYVKAQHASILALDLLMPLAILIRTTTSKPTAEKAFAVLKAYFEACNKHKTTPAVDDAEPVLALLASVHEEMTKDGSKLHANACSRASLFLAKTLVALDPSHYSAVAAKYAALQEKWWLDPKSKVHGSVFTEWTSWSIATRKQA
ncbi:hypothetical protein WHR41_08349 [Cladosporium halotolerans]|uniref:DNA polymerase V n=1 Tax=Cladosporium halotolerans TaxID=1052096 RepID=A0AB34KG88_9PEZI